MAARILTLVAFLGLAGSVGYFTYLQFRPSPVCEVCHRSVHEATAYHVELDDGTSTETCCPRCGLRFQLGREDTAGTEVADFETGTMIDAREAVYVEASSVNLCHRQRVREDRAGSQYQLTWDRCTPSLIAFETRQAAAAFQRDYGGSIKSYDELLHEAD